jgi:hypothetical protein
MDLIAQTIKIETKTFWVMALAAMVNPSGLSGKPGKT